MFEQKRCTRNSAVCYNFGMDNPKLTDELRSALSDGTEVVVEDDQTGKKYVIVQMSLHNQAIQALREKEDRESIQRGLEDMEAGRVHATEEVDNRIRAKLGFA